MQQFINSLAAEPCPLYLEVHPDIPHLPPLMDTPTQDRCHEAQLSILKIPINLDHVKSLGTYRRVADWMVGSFGHFLATSERTCRMISLIASGISDTEFLRVSKTVFLSSSISDLRPSSSRLEISDLS